jgi:hypothetical protein
MDIEALKKFVDEAVDPEYLELIKQAGLKNEAKVAEIQAEKAARNIDDIPENELRAMSKDEFWKLVGPKGNRSKRTVTLIAQRKARENQLTGKIAS